ncbi:hypothetical protein EJ04DRAFT_496879 [Polyplosphaeria fusca]|uniref:AB hydrolase-1 domain-containing protein n=1 Tax=Polyplosphaeria fusca TaxID=682080 RepID=A0A9P4QX39_9PLEO|nr:hypothetical protein EJ04DRAFT_496879 [Polyplosphaeria fusca]
MIGTSIAENVFIRTCILGLRAITPLSIFYVAFSIAEPPSSTPGKVLLSWCALETAFWLLVYLPCKRALHAPANHPPLVSRVDRHDIFQKCAEHIPNPEYYLSKWFLGARSFEVRRDNVKDFMAWAMLNKGDGDEKKGEEAQAEEEELEGYVDGIEKVLGRSIEPGRGTATSLRLTVDKVGMLHRPFLWYLIVGAVDTLTAAYLAYNGFILYRRPFRLWLTVFPWRICDFFTRRVTPASEMSYWYRPHTSRTRLPILFIHGIGIGLYPYARFLSEINKDDELGADDGQIGIIALEIMPISFRITGEIPHKSELCRQINAILDEHGWNKVVLASHSYGSVITTHLLKNSDTAHRIGPMLFVDPVTFLVHLPDVCYNFTARPPRRANEHQLYYFASNDMMVAHTLARHFFWSENILWKEDIRRRDVTVSLGGRDLIVDTETVGKYLAGVDMRSEDPSWKDADYVDYGVQLLWFPTCDHAQVFERADGRRKLGDRLRLYAKEATESDVA